MITFGKTCVPFKSLEFEEPDSLVEDLNKKGFQVMPRDGEVLMFEK